MDESRRRTLAFVASQLVFVAALIHVGVGVIEWLRYARFGILVPPDARWPLFVGSGVAIVVGLGLASRAERRRPYYLAGVVVMVGYVLAYFGWHLGGHRQFLLFGPGTSHELTVGFVIDHYFAGAMETVSLTVELVAAVLCSVLYVEGGD